MSFAFWNRRSKDEIWKPMPLEGKGVKYLIVDGNGKDCEVELGLTDGRRFCMPAGDVRVTASAGTTLQIEGSGDSSLRVEYFGADLVIRRARLGAYTSYWLDEREAEGEFEQALKAFSESDGCDDLNWTVNLDIELATTSNS